MRESMILGRQGAYGDRMHEVLRTVEGPAGRALSMAQWGDPAGIPVFFFHGTPGSRVATRVGTPESRGGGDANADRYRGMRIIVVDRPGYGRSDRHPGRSVADCAQDVAAVADSLGLERFAVSGASGGGPHALAVAAMLPQRVLRARCVSGLAPPDAAGLDWYAGMDAKNVREYALGVSDSAGNALRDWLERYAADKLRSAAPLLEPDRKLGEADAAALADRDLQAALAAGMREAYRTGIWGHYDDVRAFTRPWGFDVRDIKVPVEIRYGAADVIVPSAHSAWLGAAIPGATVLVDRNTGHFSGREKQREQLRAWLHTPGLPSQEKPTRRRS